MRAQAGATKQARSDVGGGTRMGYRRDMPIFWATVCILGILGCIAVLGIAAWLEPDPRGHGTHTQLGLPPCRMMEVNRTPCVSCGMTTSFANMIRGRVGAAFAANPAGVLLFLLTLATPLWLGHSLRTCQDPFRFLGHRIGRWLLPGVVLCVVVAWLPRILA